MFVSVCSVNKFSGGAPVFNWHEIRKRKRKGSKSRPHSSPDPSCGREESRGGAIPFPQKNSLPRRPVRRSFSGGGVQISFQDFRQKMFELRPKNTAVSIFYRGYVEPYFERRLCHVSCEFLETDRGFELINCDSHDSGGSSC